MSPISGGLEAPPNNVGLGQRGAPRGRVRNARRRPPRRQSPRAQAIMEALEKARGGGTIAPQKPGIGPLPIGPGQRRLPTQAMAQETAAARRPVRNPIRNQQVDAAEQRPARAQPGVGDARNLDLGNQLARRVQQGAISEDQAQQTMHEREILKAAFGKDWRSKIPMPEAGGGRNFRELRTDLAGEGQGDPNLEQAYQEALKSRLEAVEQARQTLRGRRRRRGGAVGGARPAVDPAVAY